jgi:Tfp pilus assembly protein PilN
MGATLLLILVYVVIWLLYVDAMLDTNQTKNKWEKEIG